MQQNHRRPMTRCHVMQLNAIDLRRARNDVLICKFAVGSYRERKHQRRFIEKFLENQRPNSFNLALPAAKYLITNAVNPTRLFILTLMAMIAFASNSLLCRAALKQTSIDAASFTFVRIFSGAAALWLIM